MPVIGQRLRGLAAHRIQAVGASRQGSQDGRDTNDHHQFNQCEPARVDDRISHLGDALGSVFVAAAVAPAAIAAAAHFRAQFAEIQ